MIRRVLRLGRRVGIAIAGGLVILLGVLLLPLPGPGTVVVVAGLGILSLEFERPRVWLAQGRDVARYWTSRARLALRQRRRRRGRRP